MTRSYFQMLQAAWRLIRNGNSSGWECHNRLHFTAELIRSVNDDGAKVLDIGGATGKRLLAERIDASRFHVLDLKWGADIMGSAHELPLKDRSYDVVTCIDTLEHMPARLRAPAVSEMLRVAARNVILVAPVDSEENRRAEEIVWELTGNRFIAEHRQNGLVDVGAIEDMLREMQQHGRVGEYRRWDIDNLMTWVVLMTRGRVDTNTLYRRIHFLENRFVARRFVLSIDVVP